APAALAYACGMQCGWDWLELSYFVGCGVSRLARYNATAAQLAGDEGKVKYFEGTPIPTSLVLVVVLAVAAWQGHFGTGLCGCQGEQGPRHVHLVVRLFATSGWLMRSKSTPMRVP